MKRVIALALTFVFLTAFAVSGDTVTLTIEGGASVTFDANLKSDGVELGENGEIPGSLYPVKELDKYGYINEQGITVIKHVFSEAERFHEGYAVVKLMDSHGYGYIDKAGRLVIPYQYDEARQFSEGLAAVKKDGKWGYINTSGEIVIPFQFEAGGPFSEGRAAVAETVDEKVRFGYIDETGKNVIPCEYITADSFSGGLARVSYPGEYYHFIDTNGKTVISMRGIYYGFSEGLSMREMKQYCYRFINSSGQQVTKDYWYAYPYFSDGLTVVADSYSQYYFIKPNGAKAFGNKTFVDAKPFSDGYAAVRIYKYQDHTQAPAAPPTNVGCYYPPPMPSYYAYIDHNGEYATDKRFDEAGSFQDGFAVIEEREEKKDPITGRSTMVTKQKLINKNFEIVWVFDDYVPFRYLR